MLPIPPGAMNVFSYYASHTTVPERVIPLNRSAVMKELADLKKIGQQPSDD